MQTGKVSFLACLLCSAAFAQSSSLPSFTIADIHLSKTKTGRFRMNLSPAGRYQIWNATLVGLIGAAWGIDGETMSGGPPWLNEDHFDMVALVPAGTSPADRSLMLRSLLMERFGLVVHDDRKPLHVFALVQSKRGAQLKQSVADGLARCNDEEPGNSAWVAFTCWNTSMAKFAAELRSLDPSVTRPVVDRTGLQGAWDFSVRFMPLFDQQVATAAGQSSPGVKLFDALEKIGLRLEQREESVPVLAIDHVNRNPAPNSPDIAVKLPSAPEEFEVAEVKPSPPGTEQRGNFRAAGLVELRAYTLRELIQAAWELDNDRIAEAPKWLDTDRYDMVAKAPPATSGDDLLPMLKSLLIDRFKLATHTADRPVTVYLLTAGKNPKLKPSDPSARSECTISRGQTGNGPAAMPLKVYTCKNTTMARFAELIRPQAAGYIRNPVVDQTGLTGGYDFTLSWTRADVQRAAQNRKQDDGSAGDPTGAITVFDAVEHQLGLKLEGGKKYPLPMLIIDHAEPVKAQ
jgi:uncharacterized protein (TIGR03435 family)